LLLQSSALQHVGEWHEKSKENSDDLSETFMDDSALVQSQPLTRGKANDMQFKAQQRSIKLSNPC